MSNINRKKRSLFVRLFIMVFVATQILPIFYKNTFTIPNTSLTFSTDQVSFLKHFSKPAQALPLLNASDTLSNSRLSYRASIAAAGGTSGSSTVTIDTGDADQNTNHLFPNDAVCFSGSGLDGCQNRATYTVANISSTTVFNTTTTLTGGLMTNDYAIASQSAIHTIVFTTSSVVPSGGDIYITVPAPATDAQTNDGMPDTAATTALNGFDLNDMTATEITVGSSGCANTWDTPTLTDSTGGSADHTIEINRITGSCAAGSTITVTIGHASDVTKRFVNPAPITGHAQGTADTYQINIKTRGASDVLLDQSDVVVAPIEAVLVSATVDEILNFSVAGQGASASRCGQTTDVVTTAYSVPWGTISTVNSFLEGAQLLTVSTNADAGYSVTIEEDDQMNKDSDACDSPANGTADYTDNCIKDTLCGSVSCSESAGRYWTDASTYHGLGISLHNLSGTDASWLYDSTTEPCTTTGGGTSTNFCARQIADQQASESKGTIMTNPSQVSGSTVYVCYRISISGLQPAGYYQNKVKYTATAIF